MTSLCWLMWACWHARRQTGWEAGSTGGENSKLLALYHAGMLCSRGPRWHAGMRASRKARRPECATARMRNCSRAIMRACSVRANAGMRACARAERLGGVNAKLLALWHVGMLGLKGLMLACPTARMQNCWQSLMRACCVRTACVKAVCHINPQGRRQRRTGSGHAGMLESGRASMPGSSHAFTVGIRACPHALCSQCLRGGTIRPERGLGRAGVARDSLLRRWTALKKGDFSGSASKSLWRGETAVLAIVGGTLPPRRPPLGAE